MQPVSQPYIEIKRQAGMLEPDYGLLRQGHRVVRQVFIKRVAQLDVSGPFAAATRPILLAAAISPEMHTIDDPLVRQLGFRSGSLKSHCKLAPRDSQCLFAYGRIGAARAARSSKTHSL